MGVGITAVGYAVPNTKLDNVELSRRFGAARMAKIQTATGILERRVAVHGECASDFAFAAAQKIFEAGVDPKSIDLVLMCTQTPDYQLPSTACLLQTRLGIPTCAAAFDVGLGCSQFVYGLGIANAWIKSAMARRALVLSGETPSRMLNPRDSASVPIFGDGGAAAIVEKTSGAGFLSFDFGSDGRGAKDLIRRTGGMREPRTSQSAVENKDESGAVRSLDDLFMDGGNVFLFGFKNIPATVSAALKKANLTKDDISLFAFHQASETMVASAARRLCIPREKLHYKLHDIGNIGGSSVAAVLADAFLAGKIKAGDKIVLCAFGVGLSWATSVVEWSDEFIGAFADADFTDSPPKPESQL